jgi:putative ABC transport system ATP-binding protein
VTAPVTDGAPPAQPAIDIRGLRFAYDRGPSILDIPALTVARGERVFVYGPSGSGKTTLLGVLAGVLRATEGQVTVLGSDLAAMGDAARDAFRALHVGYVFQLFNLIPYLTVLENIVLPCRLDARRRRRLGSTSLDAAGRAMAQALDIGELVGEPVTALSVGQQQRVAAARALIGSPELVIADEPTSALDSDRRERFLELLFRSCAAAGSTLVFVSHDRQLMPLFDRGISLPEVNRAAPRTMAAAGA